MADDKNIKSNSYWKDKLTPEQYRIAREKGTERPFTGALTNCKEKGTYVCACCGQELFKSDTKYDSGSGWPSFWAPADSNNIEMHTDESYGIRTEITCSKCAAHLGHVFDDGPAPTNQRYCINSAALKLNKKD